MTAEQKNKQGTPVPLYLQVKQSIIEKIHTAKWRANDRIPSESELVSQFQCSRMTANRALRELTAEGLLVRLQGVGTFVAEPKGQSALFEIHSIEAEIIARNHKYSCRIIKLEEIQASTSLASELNIPPETPVFHSIIIHMENDVPVQIEDRYVNALAAPDYLKQNFLAVTPHDYLSQVAPLTQGEHIVEAVEADERSAKLLQINAGASCLLITRRTWSQAFIVTSTKLLFPGNRYKLKGSFSS
ncbi:MULTISPECIES: histidine utilization repressor [Providencia]|uniref:histidine utilization repressor n=1 Tax=Providencia TaxID=586 RepID=UPI00197CCCC2|nr:MULTISPECIES: histidine utilization repressor [Providencia]HEC8330044.1 histidine utilization repressor [Providencia rettgeri]MBN4863604.1 histidine utilization repressor [Providencia stuartii]MBN4872926.1 histidine utilization repressor [Providencia stuartii]MBN4877953.1 histidine utilization repressor [Providencia stuartii]MBN4882127.1 histidine utilization repressor [Providencia stuartii]